MPSVVYMKFALVIGGIVQTIVEGNSINDFPDLKNFLVPVDDSVKYNQSYKDGEFVETRILDADLTPVQIRSAFVMDGLDLQKIIDILNALPKPDKDLYLIEWEYSLSFNKNSKLMIIIFSGLLWSADQVDQFWKFANTL